MISLTRRTLEIAAFITALLIAAMALHAWRASSNEQARLASTLAAQKKLLDAADSRESARQTALNSTLAQIETLKRATLTPEQILRALSQYLSLPQPITLATPSAPSAAARGKGTALPEKPSATAPATTPLAPSPQSTSADSSPSAGSPTPTMNLPAAPVAQVPAADLKPIYDFVQDCRACQAKLAAATQDKVDDAAKIAALERERDAAITASKGGTFWRRLRRNALWFAVGAGFGAAGGYAASKH